MMLSLRECCSHIIDNASFCLVVYFIACNFDAFQFTFMKTDSSFSPLVSNFKHNIKPLMLAKSLNRSIWLFSCARLPIIYFLLH